MEAKNNAKMYNTINQLVKYSVIDQIEFEILDRYLDEYYDKSYLEEMVESDYQVKDDPTAHKILDLEDDSLRSYTINQILDWYNNGYTKEESLVAGYTMLNLGKNVADDYIGTKYNPFIEIGYVGGVDND